MLINVQSIFWGYNELGTEVHVTESQMIAFGFDDKLLCNTVQLFVLLVRALIISYEDWREMHYHVGGDLQGKLRAIMIHSFKFVRRV